VTFRDRQLSPIVFVALLFFSLLFTSTSSATTVQEHWKSPTPTKNGQIGIFYDDRELYDNSIGLYGGVTRDGKVYSELCDSLLDPDCATAVKFSFNANLPPCVAGFTTNCVVELYLIDAKGSKTEATFKKFATEESKHSWNGGGVDRVPSSRPESIWEVSGLTGTGTTQLAVSAIVSGSYRPKKSDLFIDRLSGTINAVTEIARPGRKRSEGFSSEVTWMDTALVISDNQNIYWNGGFGWQSPDDCAAVATDICYQRQPMPAGVSVGMKIRLVKPVVGWIHGRFKAPKVEIKSESGDQVIDVRGEPITIPVIGGYFDESGVSKSIWDEFLKHPYGTIGTPDNGTARRIQGFYPLDNLLPLTRLEKYLELFNDQASATPSVWMFASVENRSLEESLKKLGSASKCVLDNPSVSGIVATNATSYLGAVPEYDEKEGALNYRVAAPHYDTNRKEFLGTYDLVVDSKVARCIYNLDASNVKATVEILASDSGSRVVASVLSEKDGWLNLGTYGFTYSSPTIKVKLAKDNAVISTTATTPSPTPSPSVSAEATTPLAQPSATKVVGKTKKTIFCLKGAIKKKVSGVSPKCPKGFRQA